MIKITDFDATAPEYRLWQDCEDSTVIRFFPAKEKKSDAAIIIFAGGAYHHKAAHESDGYGEFLSDIGINSFVVDYSVCPAHFPIQLSEARRAVRFVRYYAKKFGIDENKVAVMGSSAGGHLAALVSTYRDKIEGESSDEIDAMDSLPNAQILCYPVISMANPSLFHYNSRMNLLGEENLSFAEKVSPELIVDEKTPLAFIWHTFTDASVNVINSYEYAAALRRKNVPTELHIFPEGPHGLGLVKNTPLAPSTGEIICDHVAQWVDLFKKWLGFIGFMNE